MDTPNRDTQRPKSRTDRWLEPHAHPWSLDARDYPASAPLEARAAFLVRYALLAPSYLNAQPWKFAIEGDEVLVSRDPLRRLPVADPADRDLLLGVGAALSNLRVAAAHFGLAATVRAEPQGTDLLARVRLSEVGPVERRLAGLFPAVTARRTDRGELRDEPLGDAQRRILASATASDQARLRLFTVDPPKAALAQLIYECTVERMADRRYRHERAGWLRPGDAHETDGLASDRAGLGSGGFRTTTWVTRNFNIGETAGMRLARLARANAVLVAVFSGDDTASLLDAGQLMERFVLTATGFGMRCSFFSLPPNVSRRPGEFVDLLSADGIPQVVFRAGYPTARACPPTPRRPLRDVLVA
ncbi:MAG: hypothetical protein WCN81_00365 [Actinomycetes bacterium]